jgi:MFS family permease
MVATLFRSRFPSDEFQIVPLTIFQSLRSSPPAWHINMGRDDDSSSDIGTLAEPLLSSSLEETLPLHPGAEVPERCDVVLRSTPSPDDPWKNHNVILSFLLCIVSGIADSIWISVVLSGFLLALAGAMGDASQGNTLVGTAEAVQGVTQLVTALPIGYCADIYGKAKTVRLGAILMLVTIALTLWALVDVRRNAEDSPHAARRSYIVLVVALGFWGVVCGFANGPSQALFADSIRQGRRSEMLTWLYSCYLLCSAIGPLVSIVMILTVSASAEVWSLSEIFPVFFVGVLLEIPAAILMLFFSDKYALTEADDAAAAQAPPSSTALDDVEVEAATCTNECLVNGVDTSPLLGNGLALDAAPPPENAEAVPFLGDIDTTTAAANPSDEMPPPTAVSNPRKALIPYILFLSSLISSLGSGASVKYFPLFFKQVGFGSAAVQGIFLVVPLSISACSFVAQELGKRCGRVETSVGSILLGVALLLGMTGLSQEVDASSSLWTDHPYRAAGIVVVYLLRTGIINCSYPLLESILMDTVPSPQRARWKSLESIAAFGWTGSALVGGILSDEHSYQFTFLLTAYMQLASGVILLLIQPLVEKE